MEPAYLLCDTHNSPLLLHFEGFLIVHLYNRIEDFCCLSQGIEGGR